MFHCYSKKSLSNDLLPSQSLAETHIVKLGPDYLRVGGELFRAGTHLVGLTGRDEEIAKCQEYRVTAVPSQEMVAQVQQVPGSQEH